ncbi:MAG: DNA adenine methylase [Proteobacteria bacterium]|nr:DNA adenine methylase [Pseudomonadota bacterium]MCL2306750.1 DNA adenine methylase [Pseudomonadota bacterium]
MLQQIQPVSPVAAYVGGKSRLAAQIIDAIAEVPHQTYAEPFVGMGGVFLRRPFRAKGEVINDYSRDVATFFRVLQRHYTPFLEMLRYQITTRADFDRLLKTPPNTLTDLERSARFLYLQRVAYGGKRHGQTFGSHVDRPGKFDITKLIPMLDDVHERLASVIIECLPYGDFISRYDRATTLFYLDPPYYQCEDYYGKGLFERADFERLATQLTAIKGRFILSLNDHVEIRRIFKGFKFKQVKLKYTVGSNNDHTASELLISN